MHIWRPHKFWQTTYIKVSGDSGCLDGELWVTLQNSLQWTVKEFLQNILKSTVDIYLGFNLIFYTFKIK